MSNNYITNKYLDADINDYSLCTIQVIAELYLHCPTHDLVRVQEELEVKENGCKVMPNILLLSSPSSSSSLIT